MMKRIKQFFSAVTIEPPVFLLCMSYGFYQIVSSELYIVKVCKVNLALGDDICDHIQDHKDHQVQVQKYVAQLQIYNRVLQAIPSFFFALLAGPWSDVYGRKFFLISSLFGFVFNNSVFMLNTYFFYELKAEYLLFECLQDFTGGTILFFLTAYAYIADVSPAGSRTKRMAILNGLWPVGNNIGKALGALIKKRLGFLYNFAFGMMFALLAMVYIMIFVKESIKPEDRKDTPKKKVKAKLGYLFSIENCKSGMMAIIKNRDHNLRRYICLMLFVFQFMMFNFVGDFSNRYLFLRRSLGFDMQDYTRFSITVGSIGVFAQFILVPMLSERFLFHDATLTAMDMIASTINCLIMAFATDEWMLYVGALINCMDGASFSTVRSMVTKSVTPQEVGAILAAFGSIQSIMPMIATPVFGSIYRLTVADFPQLYLLVAASCFFVNGILCIIVRRGLRHYDKVSQEPQELANPEVESPMVKQRPKSWYPASFYALSEEDSDMQALNKTFSQSVGHLLI